METDTRKRPFKGGKLTKKKHRVSMKLALITIRNAGIQKLTVQFVWRAGFYLRDVSKTIDRRRS